MKSWLPRAIQLLQTSLRPPRHEVNELDWKGGLSPAKKRLAEHLSAFGNHPGGGSLVFGIPNSRVPDGVTRDFFLTALSLVEANREIDKLLRGGVKVPDLKHGGQRTEIMTRKEPAHA